MAILLDNENRVFTLQTDHSMYQIKADRYGVLLHTWFGKKGTPFDHSYLITYADRGFSGNPYDAENERTYSLDALPQEYSSYGSGDYRSCALKIQYPDGTSSCELRYAGHQLLDGKYSIPGLPALYQTTDNQSDTLVITLEDTRNCFYVHLYYGVMEDLDIITRSVCIENRSGQPLWLDKAASACVDYLYGDFDVHTFYGRHTMERNHQRTAIHHGIQSIGSTRGMSSHHYNPFLILSDQSTTETAGECYGFSFLYSGDFIASTEFDTYNQTRVLMGIHPDNFHYCLNPGERFYAPEVAMAYSEHGLEQLSHIFHKAFRCNLCRGKFKKTRRPVLLNSWEGVYFDFTGEKLLRMAKDASEMGIELFVMDDGWFGKRDNDVSGLGDWIVNEDKLGCTLRELSEKVHELGLQFGIWFEPECVSEDSDLYRAHPDWALQIPGKSPTRSRYQLVLDFSREDVREHIYQQICDVLDSARIEYLKWDFNRSICDIRSAVLPADRQGEVTHRFILGLYDMLEKLSRRYPDLLIEGCCGGGGRFDAGMLYYTPQIWTSDNTDAIERLTIQYGTSFCYPISAMGAHVAQCPNEQTGRCTPLDTRATVAMSGTFGYELDVNHMSEEEKLAVRQQIEEFKKYYELIQYGDYYRLTDPVKTKDYHCWQFTSPDKSEALLCAVALQIRPNGPGCRTKLRGLLPGATYLINGQEYPGDALMNAGIPLPKAKEEYESFRIHIVKKEIVE